MNNTTMKNSHSSLITVFALGCGAMLASTTLAPAAILIDDFSQGTNFVLNAANGTLVDRQGPFASVLDTGFRDTKVRNYGATQGSGNSLVVSSGLLSATRGPGTDGFDFQTEYTGISDLNLGNWNYTGLSGQTSLVFDFATNTTASLRVNVQAAKWDPFFNNYVTSPSSIGAVAVGASSATVDLTPLGLNTFGGIDALIITYNYNFDNGFSQTINQSFSVNTITAVPEPSSGALLGLGCLALLAHRRFRRHARSSSLN